LKKLDVFESATSKMRNEFSQCSTLHADWEFVLTDKKTREIKNVKKFRILAILNDVERYQHIGVIIPELSNEYVQLPDLVEKFLLEMRKNVGDTSNDDKTFDVSAYRFTRNVYLYTDKLLVSEDALKKYFQDHNLLLQIRMEKRNMSL
jgi:hypothetical protein